MTRKSFFEVATMAVLFMAAAELSVAGEIASAVAQAPAGGDATSYDGVVEAVRQTVVSAQVAGAIVAIEAKVGDVVRAGQVLARIDARAAEQNVAASDALVQSARATLEVATRDFERQKQLFEMRYTSQAALDRAEAQFKATQAQVGAQLAQAGAARTQSGFFVVRAPYGGVISEVPVTLGDMAMPGRALMTLYDPAALRVTASIPQTDATRMEAGKASRVQVPALPGDRQWIAPTRVTVLPTTDSTTHTAQVRLDLPASVGALSPGTFARAWLPMPARSASRVYVPVTAVVRRAEMTGVYVFGADGRPLLRQVRLGRVVNDTVEILSGVSAGERVAVDSQVAARVR